MATMKNVLVTIDGREVLTPDLKFGLGDFEIAGSLELAIPRDLVALRSVSPAAKKLIAKRRVQDFIDRICRPAGE